MGSAMVGGRKAKARRPVGYAPDEPLDRSWSTDLRTAWWLALVHRLMQDALRYAPVATPVLPFDLCVAVDRLVMEVQKATHVRFDFSS